MRITYYALRPIPVGEDIRNPGDLVPEANGWPYLSGYLTDGSLAPVLVATLPEAQQKMLIQWEKAQSGEMVEETVKVAKTKAKVDADV